MPRQYLEKAVKNPPQQHVDTKNKPVRISYLTEQTSHHPPVSAWWVDCPVKGVSARGFDQLSAKFTGTSIKVTPGNYNLGIFINIKRRDNEEYQLTHPTAYLGGIIRGSLSVTVSDRAFVLCPKTKNQSYTELRRGELAWENTKQSQRRHIQLRSRKRQQEPNKRRS